jgi:TP901 family phage tail tape measure protein
VAADAQKVIELVFNGVDKTGAAVQSALTNVSGFAGSVKSATQPVADLTMAAVKLEAGILAAGVAAVAFSVNAAGDFDSAFRQISTIIDASAEDLDGFKNAILDYASTSTQPLEKITTALGNAIGSGVDWADSLALIATAEKLAVATRSDLDGTTKVLVSTLNSYGMEITDAGRLSDLFFKVIDEGDISMTDLANSFAKVAPIAKISGVSLEEVGAAIATLTASGIKPAESIEYLRGAISNIISPSGQARDLAAELGIEFNASGLKANGLAGILQQVAEKTGGSADKMKILFGDIGGFTAAATLAGPQAEKFAASILAMGDSTGSVDAAFAKMTDSIDVATAKVGNSLTALFVRIGTPLLDEFGGIANAIAAIFNAMGASVKEGSLGTLVDYVEGLMGQLKTTLETVAKNLPAALEGADFSGFTRGIDVVVQSIKDLFGNIDLSTVEGLQSAIELVGAAFLGLSSYVSGVIDSFKPLFDTLVSVGSGLSDMDSGIFKTAGEMAGFVTQANMLAGGLNSLLPALEALVSILVAKQGAGLVGAMAGAATGAGGLAAALGSAGLGAAAGVAGYAVGTTLVDPIDKLVTKLSGSENSLGTWIYELINGGNEAEKFGAKAQTATDGVDKLGESVTTAGKAVEDSKDPFQAANAAMLATFAASEKAAAGSQKLAEATGTASRGIAGVKTIIDEATGKIIGYEQAVTKGSTATKAIADETKKVEDATRRWNEEIAKMNFQEKLKMIESQTKIMTAQIEADAKKTVAAFESIGTTITSTGDVLSSLFGQLKDFSSMDWSAISMIKDQIEKENKLRQEAFDLQKKLTEAQIAQMNAQTDALLKGDGLIKIDGAGLKPHLEAFMWEILRAIQIKVNKDGLKMLLGA